MHNIPLLVILQKVMKKAVLTILTLFWLTTIKAQHDTLKCGGGWFFPVFNEADISEFNNFLVANNLKTRKYPLR